MHTFMLCYAMLCYFMLCYLMLWYVEIWCNIVVSVIYMKSVVYIWYMFRILFSYWLMFLPQKYFLSRNSIMNKIHLSIPKGCLLAGNVQRILFICIDLTMADPVSWYCPVFSLTESVWQLTNAIRVDMLTKTLNHHEWPIVGNFKNIF